MCRIWAAIAGVTTIGGVLFLQPRAPPVKPKGKREKWFLLDFDILKSPTFWIMASAPSLVGPVPRHVLTSRDLPARLDILRLSQLLPGVALLGDVHLVRAQLAVAPTPLGRRLRLQRFSFPRIDRDWGGSGSFSRPHDHRLGSRRNDLRPVRLGPQSLSRRRHGLLGPVRVRVPHHSLFWSWRQTDFG